MDFKKLNEELEKFVVNEEARRIDDLLNEQVQKLQRKYSEYTFKTDRKEYYGGHDYLIDISVPLKDDTCIIHLLFENIRQKVNEYSYWYTFHLEVELTAEDEDFRKKLQNIFGLKNRNGVMKGYLQKMAGMKRISQYNGFQIPPTIYTEKTKPVEESISIIFTEIDDNLKSFTELVSSMDKDLKHKKAYKKSETPRQKSRFIDLFYEKSQWGLDIQLKVMTKGYQVVSHLGGYEYGEYNPNQETDNMSKVCKDWKKAIEQAVEHCLEEDDLVEDLLYGDAFASNEYAQYFKSKLEEMSEQEDEDEE